MDVLAWLRDADPALRWQVERDLLGEPPTVWEATRARVTTEGFGARLLAKQDPDGQWAGGAFFPADFDFASMKTDGQPWTATTWVLNDLREWGVDAAALSGTAELLAENSQWEYENLPYWGGEVDCCINAWTLMNGLWLGADVAGIMRLVRRAPPAGRRLELRVGRRVDALVRPLDTQLAQGPAGLGNGDGRLTGDPRRPPRRRGIPPGARPLPPPVDRRTGAAGRERLFAPLPLALRRAQRGRVLPPRVPAGRHAPGPAHGGGDRADPHGPAAGRQVAPGPLTPGRVWFETDVPEGEPSKWLTLSATRVLAWWDGS